MSTAGVDLSVIVPVYDNAATLDELIERLVAVLDATKLAFEVILVDDGSADDSYSILRGHAARDARIHVYGLARNFGGQAAACAALDRVRGRWVMSIDADLENRPEDIPAFLRELERGAELVCGYRSARDAPWLTRRLPSWLMNAYVRRRTGVPIRDLGCGMKAFQAWLIRDLAAEGEARRLLPPLLLQRARAVREVPVQPTSERQRGGHTFLSLLAMAADYYLLTAGRPFLIAGLVALVGMLGGAIAIVAGRPLEGLVLAVGGGLALLLSLVGEYCQRLYHLARGAPFYRLRDTKEPEQEAPDRRTSSQGERESRRALR